MYVSSFGSIRFVKSVHERVTVMPLLIQATNEFVICTVTDRIETCWIRRTKVFSEAILLLAFQVVR
jgi:hypothetical protein